MFRANILVIMEEELNLNTDHEKKGCLSDLHYSLEIENSHHVDHYERLSNFSKISGEIISEQKSVSLMNASNNDENL